METCIEYCEPGYAYISSDEKRWITCITKLAKERPDECIIMYPPETNHGIIYAKFPQKWVRVRPPKQVVMSDEDRANLAQRLLDSRRKEAKE